MEERNRVTVHGSRKREREEKYMKKKEIKPRGKRDTNREREREVNRSRDRERIIEWAKGKTKKKQGKLDEI